MEEDVFLIAHWFWCSFTTNMSVFARDTFLRRTRKMWKTEKYRPTTVPPLIIFLLILYLFVVFTISLAFTTALRPIFILGGVGIRVKKKTIHFGSCCSFNSYERTDIYKNIKLHIVEDHDADFLVIVIIIIINTCWIAQATHTTREWTTHRFISHTKSQW